jgi:hypothetical protein
MSITVVGKRVSVAAYSGETLIAACRAFAILAVEADHPSPGARVERLERAQAELRALVADDAWAMSFQSLGQYRSALLAAFAARAALFPAQQTDRSTT